MIRRIKVKVDAYVSIAAINQNIGGSSAAAQRQVAADFNTTPTLLGRKAARLTFVPCLA